MKFTNEQLLVAEAVLSRALKLRHEEAMSAEDFKAGLRKPIEPYMKQALEDIEFAASFIQQRESR
jgi:hypothetical protein